MNHRTFPAQRFLWMAAGSLAAAAVLATASPASAAEQAESTAAKRPAGRSTSAPAPARATVKVINVPTQDCPADDNEAMTAMRAFIDPKTGELRAPTPEEEAALARALAPAAARRAQASREPFALADGTMVYELGEEGMMDAVARLGPDGKPVLSCTPRSETPKALTRPLPSKDAAARVEK